MAEKYCTQGYTQNLFLYLDDPTADGIGYPSGL